MDRSAFRAAVRLAPLVFLLAASCIVATHATRVNLACAPTTISSPARAHLDDGSVVVFASGLMLSQDVLYGEGVRYDFLRGTSARVHSVPLKSVVGLERYEGRGGLGVPIGLVGVAPSCCIGGVALFKYIFGCCPTIYSFDGSSPNLEAEAFSFNVTRLMSGRDLDKLESGRLEHGEYRLLVANEALETHYIDQLSLVSVDHEPGYRALPTDGGRVVLLGKTTPLASAVDAAGRDVLPLVASRDSAWYHSDTGLVRQLADSVVHDWIDIAVPVPRGARRLCLALRGRNALLSTVMFYDVTLKEMGLSALDMMGWDWRHILYAWNLERWHRRHFGIRVLTPTASGFQELAWIKDTGPIAWHEVAVQLPVKNADTCRLRLDILPDNWIIDQVEVSFEQSAPAQVSEWTPATLDSGDGRNLDTEIASLARCDGKYLITGPGDSRRLTFASGETPAGTEREYFVRTGGYYIEWLRPEWLRSTPAARAAPDDRTICRAAALWLQKKDAFERQFAETRLPLRRMP